MSEIFFISDTHWGHRNIINLTGRPFASVEEMNEKMIANWNERVKSDDDIVYHLGDFAFGTLEFHQDIFDKLKGKKVFIKGNHDDWKKIARMPWADVKDYSEIKIGDQRLVLCHYPILSWNKAHYGAIHLHGHTHEKSPLEGVCEFKWMNVCVEMIGYAPISFDEIMNAFR
jgi:calcineurin-like phosphoesterase family protein